MNPQYNYVTCICWKEQGSCKHIKYSDHCNYTRCWDRSHLLRVKKLHDFTEPYFKYQPDAESNE